MSIADKLRKFEPCEDAIAWAEQYDSEADAWRECNRGDWMAWLLGMFRGEPESDRRKKLVLCLCEVARLTLPVYEKQYPRDNRVRHCIDVTEQWARGVVTDSSVFVAASAAAYAAASAAVGKSAFAAAYAADAYAAAAYQALATATGDAKTKMRKRIAGIIRKHYPDPPEEE